MAYAVAPDTPSATFPTLSRRLNGVHHPDSVWPLPRIPETATAGVPLHGKRQRGWLRMAGWMVAPTATFLTRRLKTWTVTMLTMWAATWTVTKLESG